MKKILIALVVVLMSAASVNAQGHGWFWFGLKGGMTSNATEVDFTAEDMQATFDGAQGYSAGIMTRFNLPMSIFSIHIQPELMYNWQKGALKNEESGKIEVADFTVNNFSIPVLAGVGLDLGLFNARVQAGPVVQFNSTNSLDNLNNETAPIDWKDVTYSWAAGVGIDLFNFIMVDFRYLGGWMEGMAPKKFGELFEFDRINKETSTWNLTLGIMF